MRFTNQPLNLQEKIPLLEEDIANSQSQGSDLQVTSACNLRSASCLNSSEGVTWVYQQQSPNNSSTSIDEMIESLQ